MSGRFSGDTTEYYPARLYTRDADGTITCDLCAHRCRIPVGGLGLCRVRQNIDGALYTLVYGRAISQHIDPIEKKPLYHVRPGSSSYSIATPGCNFQCVWCQNWEIAQWAREHSPLVGNHAPPEHVVKAAKAYRCHSIAYTYTEPTIFFEYTYDIARLAHDSGLLNVYVTNGFMTGEMLDMIHPYLDAANVDLKAFNDATYKRYLKARLQPVLDSLIKLKACGVWVEVTTLIIPDINDDPAELRDLTEFIVTHLGVDVPWHISRYFPHYKMVDKPPTPVPTLYRAREIGLEAGLRHIYVGNVGGSTGRDTVCPVCDAVLILRRGYEIVENVIADDKCPQCGATIAGIAMSVR